MITNRQKITSLRNQQKQFIENQNAAHRDEFIRQQNELRNKQTMQSKIDKYDSIITGDSNIVSNEYLVDFQAKGIDVEMHDHSLTLINSRNEIKNRYKNIMDIDQMESNNNSNQTQNKINLKDQMKLKLLERKKLIKAAKKRKQNLMKQLKNGNIESLINDMIQTQDANQSELRKKPIFRNKTKPRMNDATMNRNRKRKLNDIEDINESDDEEQRMSKRFKSKRIDKECGYAAIPPPQNLYLNNNKKPKSIKDESKNEAIELIESALIDNQDVNDNQDIQREAPLTPNESIQSEIYPPQQMYQGQQMHQQQGYQGVFNGNYVYNNPYLQYNPYMNPYQMQYQYYNQQMYSQQMYQQYLYQQYQTPQSQTNNNHTTNNNKGGV